METERQPSAVPLRRQREILLQQSCVRTLAAESRQRTPSAASSRLLRLLSIRLRSPLPPLPQASNLRSAPLTGKPVQLAALTPRRRRLASIWRINVLSRSHRPSVAGQERNTYFKTGVSLLQTLVS